jgi:lipoprotein-releasing system permease protein
VSIQLGIALTHLIHRKRSTLVSLIGIVLGVAFFLAVSSLMRGSEYDFIKRLVDNSPHITVSDEYRNPASQPAVSRWPDGAVEVRRVKPLNEVRGIRGHAQKLVFIESLPGLRAAPTLVSSVVLTFAGRTQGVTLTGAIPAKMKQVSTIEEKLIDGSLDTLAANSNGIIIGVGLAKKFGLSMGSVLNVASATGEVRALKSRRHFSHRQRRLRRNANLRFAQAGAELAGSAQPDQPLHHPARRSLHRTRCRYYHRSAHRL